MERNRQVRIYTTWPFEFHSKVQGESTEGFLIRGMIVSDFLFALSLRAH